jgi:transcriptional regulator with XRE-family HTH domain
MPGPQGSNGGKASTPRRKPKVNQHDAKPLPEIPRGKNLTAAQQGLRDGLMLQRKAQGWTNEEIAKEAGISISAVKRAIRNRKNAMIETGGRDPFELVDEIVEGFQADIGDFERMALAYAERHPGAAVGAKRSAGDARWRMVILLQATGRLPRELGTLRHIHEIRAVAALLYDSVDEMRKKIKALDLPAAKEREALEAAGIVEGRLDELAAAGEEKKS